MTLRIVLKTPITLFLETDLEGSYDTFILV